MAVVAGRHKRIKAVAREINIGEELECKVGLSRGTIIAASLNGADAEIVEVIVEQKHSSGIGSTAWSHEINWAVPTEKPAVGRARLVGNVDAVEAHKLLLGVARGIAAVLKALMRVNQEAGLVGVNGAQRQQVAVWNSGISRQGE